jgi:gamma-glutamyl-gamma-aminobutyrate hydrolase PuuD
MTPSAGLTFRDARKAEPYAQALRQAGIEPVLISPARPGCLRGLRGLLLSGGTDVNPARYGAQPYAGNEPHDDQRDELEMRLLAEALEGQRPVLAICRGMQLLNIAHGGTLLQHLPNAERHRVRDGDPAQPAHEIVVDRGTRLAEILGEGRHMVNSRHHQAVGQIGTGLQVAARSSPDGVIEGLERPGARFVLGVQWHPEDQIRLDASQKKLFEAFAGAL